jgi:histidine triad (HIT) family protein
MSELSIFEKISQRLLPGLIIDENDTHIAFLTIGPLAKGHTLVVPKSNISDYLFSLEDKAYTELLLFAKQVAKKLESKVDCQKVAMMVIGEEVPHVHIHLVPFQTGFGFENLKVQSPSMDELKQIHNQIIN